MKTGTLLALILMVAVAIAHALRLLTATPVIVGSFEVPMWGSVGGIIVPGVIAWLLWRDLRKR